MGLKDLFSKKASDKLNKYFQLILKICAIYYTKIRLNR